LGELKSTLAVRPVFHRRDVNIIGHVFGAFLALRLEVALQKKLAAKGWKLSWPSLLGDLAALKAVQITLDGRSYTIRTELEGDCYKGFQAVGLRPPGRLPDVRLTAGSSRLPRPTGAGRHLPDGSATA